MPKSKPTRVPKAQKLPKLKVPKVSLRIPVPVPAKGSALTIGNGPAKPRVH